jgi:hypothetical protein
MFPPEFHVVVFDYPEIECDSAKPSVRSRKDIYPTGLKNCLPVVKCIEIRPPVYLVKDDHVKFWREHFMPKSG